MYLVVVGFFFLKNSHFNSNPKRYLPSTVHSSTIYNSQDKETVQVPMMIALRRCGIYICNEILLSYQKE